MNFRTEVVTFCYCCWWRQCVYDEEEDCQDGDGEDEDEDENEEGEECMFYKSLKVFIGSWKYCRKLKCK